MAPKLIPKAALKRQVENKLNGEATITGDACKVINDSCEALLKDLIKNAAILHENRRVTSRNKSIRKEDIYTSLYSLPQYSLLRSTFLADKVAMIQKEQLDGFKNKDDAQNEESFSQE